MIHQVQDFSFTPQTQSIQTLRSIADQVRALVSRIESMKAEGDRMRQALADTPPDTDSRLAWLNTQLHNS